MAASTWFFSEKFTLGVGITTLQIAQNTKGLQVFALQTVMGLGLKVKLFYFLSHRKYFSTLILPGPISIFNPLTLISVNPIKWVKYFMHEAKR